MSMLKTKWAEKKTLTLYRLPLLDTRMPEEPFRMRAITLLEYVTTYRNDSSWLIAFSAVGTVVLLYLLSVAPSLWLWTGLGLAVVLILQDLVRASQLRVKASIYPEFAMFHTYLLMCDMAIKVWNAGLEYSIDEALNLKNTQQLVQKYWELQYARRYLSECMNKAVHKKMKIEDWQKMKSYMNYFNEHFARQ